MSRFFRGDDGSSSSSSSDSEYEEKVNVRTASKHAPVDYSDSDEDVKRISRSKKDSKHIELQNLTKKLDEAIKKSEWTQMLHQFNNLFVYYGKLPKAVKDAGAPSFLLRILNKFENKIDLTKGDKKHQQTLTKPDVKSFNTLKTRFYKGINDVKSDYEEYRKNPSDHSDSSEDEEEESSLSESESTSSGDDSETESSSSSENDSDSDTESDSESDSDSESESGSSSRSGSDSEDSIDWGSSDSESASSDSDDDYKNLSEDGPRWGAAFFLKKTSTAAVAKKQAQVLDKKVKKATKAQQATAAAASQAGTSPQSEDEAESTTSAGSTAAAALKKHLILFEDETKVTLPMFLEKTSQQYALRGKKGSPTAILLEVFKHLLEIGRANNLGPAVETKILGYIYVLHMDLRTPMETGGSPVLSCADFTDALKALHAVLDTSKKNNVVLHSNLTEEQEVYKSSGTDEYKISMNPVVFVERLDTEFNKTCQEYDHSSMNFLTMLQLEISLMAALHKAILLVNADLRTSASDDAGGAHSAPLVHKNKGDIWSDSEYCEIAIRFISHIYYKPQSLIRMAFESMVHCFPADIYTSADDFVALQTGSSSEYLTTLCKYIYTNDRSDRLRTRAILCQVYHGALLNNWRQSRDLMLMSQLQSNIHLADPSTQILFNRAMAQLGLCAFRRGHFNDAFTCLNDILSFGRAKELLGQGPPGMKYTSAADKHGFGEQEKIDKTRILPFHMHMNLELIEFVHLLSAMILEVPNMAAAPFNNKKKVISKLFRKYMDTNSRQSFVGHLEITRDYIIAASKHLGRGDWHACFNTIKDIDIWKHLSADPNVIAGIKQKYQERLKIEGLRTYMFVYSKAYKSLMLSNLSKQFGLEQQNVHSVLSKMIIREELLASWDEPAKAVIIHNADLTKLQYLAVQFSDKGTHFAETNERLSEFSMNNDLRFSSSFGNTDNSNNTGNSTTGGNKSFSGNNGSYFPRRDNANQKFTPRFGHKKQ